MPPKKRGKGKPATPEEPASAVRRRVAWTVHVVGDVEPILKRLDFEVVDSLLLATDARGAVHEAEAMAMADRSKGDAAAVEVQSEAATNGTSDDLIWFGQAQEQSLRETNANIVENLLETTIVPPTFANHSEIISHQPDRYTLLDLFSGSYTITPMASLSACAVTVGPT